MKKDGLKTNIKLQLNSAKQIRIASGKMEQKIANELMH